MTIRLPEDLERYVHEQVQAGRFLSEDEVISDALDRHRQAQLLRPAAPAPFDPVLGSMRDDADLLDEIVERAMRNREQQPWRVPAGE